MKRRLRAILLIAIAAISALLLSSCSNEEKIEKIEKVEHITTVKMDTYEHTLSIPVFEDNTKNIMQYEYHEGYEPIGISSTAYGRFADINGGGTIAYANNEPVICVAQNSSCLEFGTPINAHENDNHKGYGIGEHIISIPWESDNTKSAMEYPYHEGYKIVGVSSTAYGHYADINGGGAILYVNTVPVQNVFDENGNPTFGTQIKDNAIKLIKEE